MKQHEEVTHINIDKMDSIHEQLVTAIRNLRRRLCRQGRGAGAALRRSSRCSAGAMGQRHTQLARSGDTLQRLAALNHVPLWS